MSRNPEVLVIGGGPSGLAAAEAASGLGADVLLVDENRELGGNLRYRVQPVSAVEGEAPVRPDELRDNLIEGASQAGAALKSGVLAAGRYAGGKVLLVDGDAAHVVTPQALVVATGSTDLPFPFAGATLPGVFTARAIQILLNMWRVLPGQRFAVIGPEAEAEEVAVDIALAGGEVVLQGVAPPHLISARGGDGVRELRIGDDRYEVDCVVVAMGRQPDAALATMAGAELGFNPQLGGLVPVLTEQLQATSGVFVAGEAAGVGSVAVAIAEGRLAGLAAARAIGKAVPQEGSFLPPVGGKELEWRAEQRRSMQAIHVQPYQ